VRIRRVRHAVRFRGRRAALQEELGAHADRLTALWRDKQLQYTWLRAAQGRHADFWQVTVMPWIFSLETLGLERPTLRAKLMELYLTLEAFPEVPGVLTKLRAAGLRTAILSNGTARMLEAAVKAAGLDGLFDAVLSVEAVGVYKPHPRSISLRSIDWVCPCGPSPFSPRMPGMRTPRLPWACKSSGAIATTNVPSDCPGLQIAK
jgi:2-haloacid dehalogenase